jgi:hypothetical protein
VSAARVARREVLAERPDPPARDTLNLLIWGRTSTIRHERRRRSRVLPTTGRVPVGTSSSTQSDAQSSPWPTATPYGKADPR